MNMGQGEVSEPDQVLHLTGGTGLVRSPALRGLDVVYKKPRVPLYPCMHWGGLMALRQPRHSKEESARRGNEIYERQIRPHLEAASHGQVVAIDIDTGAFEVAEDTVVASDRLLVRYPDAQIWFVRIGHRGLHRFGPRLTLEGLLQGVTPDNLRHEVRTGPSMGSEAW